MMERVPRRARLKPPARLLSAAVALAPSLLWPAAALARAGGGEGYHGGGGGGHGGGGHGGGGGGGGGGDGLFSLIIQLIVLCFQHPYIGVPLLALICIVLVVVYTQGKDNYQSGVIRRGNTLLDDSRKAAAVAQLRRHDPAFDPAAFTARVRSAFLKLQDAWCAQDLRPVRPFISDGVHERFSLQFAEQKAEGYRNQMRDVTVTSLDVASATSDDLYDEVAVRVAARAVDYRVALANGQLLPGSSMQPAEFVEIWSFLRRRGAATRPGRPGLLEGNCPNCAAPVALNESANCANCGALLRSGEYDWVLSSITQECEWRDGGAADGSRPPVPGLPRLRRGDPDLNEQALEDRTSVVFWRKVAAERTGKIDPIRKAASPEYCDRLAAQLRPPPGMPRKFYGSCAVGSVRVRGFLPPGAATSLGTVSPSGDGNGSDGNHDAGGAAGDPTVPASREWAIVEVRWSGRRLATDPRGGPPRPDAPESPRRTLFVLARTAGAKTDVAKGISSAHCPTCGAPESGGDTAACAYCGTALNDGDHGWVLEDTVGAAGSRGQTLLAALRQQPAEGEGGGEGDIVAGIGGAYAVADGNGANGGFSAVTAPAPGGLELLAWAVKMACADGQLDPTERQVLTQLAQARRVPPARLEQLIGAAQAGRIDLPEPSGPAEARDWLSAMAATAAADGRIDRREWALLRSMGDKVGLGEAEVRDLVNRARNERYAAAATALRQARQDPRRSGGDGTPPPLPPRA